MPLVGTVGELADQKAVILEVAAAVKAEKGIDELPFLIGTMIEVPAGRAHRRRGGGARPSSSVSAPTTSPR